MDELVSPLFTFEMKKGAWRGALFVTHRVEELLSGMLVMGLFGHLELDLGSWNYLKLLLKYITLSIFLSSC